MNSLCKELLDIHEELSAYLTKATSSRIQKALDTLENSANTVGRAWSGSWIGYHANVYYKDLQPPPPSIHFNSEWGFINSRLSGADGFWHEFDPKEIINKIEEPVRMADIEQATEISNLGRELFTEKRDQIVSIIEAIKRQYDDSFLSDMLQQAKLLRLAGETDFIAKRAPNRIASRDSLAVSQGVWIPPHITILSKIFAIRNPVLRSKDLSSIAKKTVSHVERLKETSIHKKSGNKVFIGHGRNDSWKELKDFIQDRLQLEWDEFNRVPIAGIPTINRLSEMLDSALVAFLVMTAEDEQPDGKMRARMNVIHEAGLFQGRLGFTKAVLLIEEGCEEFSNIYGLGQIRFAKGRIKESFEEIRRFLEREGILKV